jgi:Ca2+-transporting ATPase
VANLSFQGLTGIQDPPRPEAKDAIALCHRAGIQIKMITGDHTLTATATATATACELGLNGEVMSGAELDAMSVDDLATTLKRVVVFARVAPRAQGQDRAGTEGRGKYSGNDRRRGQRRARAESC